ncbi:glycoside hydrolase family 2 TIM barrel-domain containing protein [Acidipropionibacterium virtanenii]|uniref:Beta-galactosidase n=1 Tax=Acidipropionibacterium virtanenii TaxID=2057246 RepID=A0A344UPN4_9ACTN|nr:glycoside hydrolase family 2 TIM barrel-domain containing protein [Acidipropionibacterium virtanenii]AXE37232.1 Beta-galactosidase [Acidipropionibacterium virtanenii]
MPDPQYLTDTGPGTGRRRPARSWLHTDAPKLSLNGAWRFRLLPGAPGTLGGDQVLRRSGALPHDADGRPEEPFAMAAAGYDDSGWDELTLPCHWVMVGDGKYGSPIYTNVQLPFPVDPPNVPDENPTGDHRRSFTLPEDWADSSRYGAVVLRFDGVESRFAVWVNGEFVGTGTGSRLASEFDVTELVHPGENVIAVRVHQWSASSYVEDQDQWWLPGIFRDVTLEARPVGGLEDVWLRADYDHQTGSGVITPQLSCGDEAFPVRLSVPGLGVDVLWNSREDVAPVHIEQVEPWSAERPHLYDATVAGDAETVSLRIGFRAVRIVGDQFQVDGATVTFHGMNRHEIRADAGRVFDEEFAREDLALMKRHNVNAIRTSHYPPHPRLLDLADEFGFWVILENDLETHWAIEEIETDRLNPTSDPTWHDALVDRMRRTVERDKNHPSIVMWSLGNESGTGANLAAMAAWTRRRDPSRPIHYEGDRTTAYTDVYSRMYPSVPEVASIGSDDTTPLHGATVTESARLRTRPFILCEYAHAMGNGPGALDRYEALVDAHPRLHGGFVWEWRDHGLLTRSADGTPFYGYGGDFGETVHDGEFVVDGMVLSDSTPSPGLAEFAAVAAPLRFGFEPDDRSLRVANHRHDADTSDLRVAWRLEHAGRQVLEGRPDVAPVPAGEAARVNLPPLPIADVGETWLTVEAALAEDARWAPAGHVVARQQFDLTPAPEPAAAPVPPRAGARNTDVTGSFDLGPAHFEGADLVRLAGRPVSGPRLELWRAPASNDALASSPSSDAHDPAASWRGADWTPTGPDASYEDQWHAAHLDLLSSRLLEASRDGSSGGGMFHVERRYSVPDSAASVRVVEDWALDGDRLALDLSMIASPEWQIVWPRFGVRFDLPAGVDHASWFGTGPGPSYPDSRHGVQVGRFEAGIDDLFVDYAVPQENGHRSDLRSLTLGSADADGGVTPWLRLDTAPDEAGRRPGFTLSRWTAQQITAAAHSFELPGPTASYLYLDAAQNGLGSRSCGPDVWPTELLRPGSRSLHLSFKEL